MHSGLVNVSRRHHLSMERRAYGKSRHLSEWRDDRIDDHAQVFHANPDGTQKSTSPVSVATIIYEGDHLWGLRSGRMASHAQTRTQLGVRWDMMDALVGQWQFSPGSGPSTRSRRIRAACRLRRDTFRFHRSNRCCLALSENSRERRASRQSRRAIKTSRRSRITFSTPASLNSCRRS